MRAAIAMVVWSVVLAVLYRHAFGRRGVIAISGTTLILFVAAFWLRSKGHAISSMFCVVSLISQVTVLLLLLVACGEIDPSRGRP